MVPKQIPSLQAKSSDMRPIYKVKVRNLNNLGSVARVHNDIHTVIHMQRRLSWLKSFLHFALSSRGPT